MDGLGQLTSAIQRHLSLSLKETGLNDSVKRERRRRANGAKECQQPLAPECHVRVTSANFTRATCRLVPASQGDWGPPGDGPGRGGWGVVEVRRKNESFQLLLAVVAEASQRLRGFEKVMLSGLSSLRSRLLSGPLSGPLFALCKDAKCSYVVLMTRPEAPEY